MLKGLIYIACFPWCKSMFIVDASCSYIILFIYNFCMMCHKFCGYLAVTILINTDQKEASSDNCIHNIFSLSLRYLQFSRHLLL